MQECERCQKPTIICVCDRITALTVKTRVLILQHPEERDVMLGTAPLLSLMVNAKRAIGITWDSLNDALDEPVVNKDWGVLYPHSLKKPITSTAPFLVLDAKGDPIQKKLTGIIALDGTWSQAKSIWWQNAWLLRHPRVLIQPIEASIYGKMRQEPRREWVSTLESVAEAMVGNGDDPSVRVELRRVMRTMMQRARDSQKPLPPR
jgi:DTW domain-containing protein YfiP